MYKPKPEPTGGCLWPFSFLTSLGEKNHRDPHHQHGRGRTLENSCNLFELTMNAEKKNNSAKKCKQVEFSSVQKPKCEH